MTVDATQSVPEHRNRGFYDAPLTGGVTPLEDQCSLVPRSQIGAIDPTVTGLNLSSMQRQS
jgi:hypothetical protein